jgi:hypothetical protein
MNIQVLLVLESMRNIGEQMMSYKFINDRALIYDLLNSMPNPILSHPRHNSIKVIEQH